MNETVLDNFFAQRWISALLNRWLHVFFIIFSWQEIELVEALCGFHKTIEMLDKRPIVITSHPGEIIKPGK